MKAIFFTLIALISIFEKGLAKEKKHPEYQVRIPYENLYFHEKGVTLVMDEYGEVPLENLHMDESGCYSVCQIAVVCRDCQKKAKKESKVCANCGSDKKDFIGVIKNQKNREFTTMVCNLLGQPLFADGVLAWSHQLEFTLKGDTDGNKGLSGTYEGKSDDEKVTTYVSGKASQNADGETTAEVEVGGSLGF